MRVRARSGFAATSENNPLGRISGDSRRLN